MDGRERKKAASAANAVLLERRGEDREPWLSLSLYIHRAYAIESLLIFLKTTTIVLRLMSLFSTVEAIF